MIELPYSLTIEATEDPDYFGLFSPDLVGFTEIGHSIEDCLYRAKWGMKEHVELLKERGLPVPPRVLKPKINVQNEESLAAYKATHPEPGLGHLTPCLTPRRLSCLAPRALAPAPCLTPNACPALRLVPCALGPPEAR